MGPYILACRNFSFLLLAKLLTYGFGSKICDWLSEMQLRALSSTFFILVHDYVTKLSCVF